jgi:hypothetical protein
MIQEALMAHNKSEMVVEAREFGRKFKADRVIILFVTKDERIGYASWGRTLSMYSETKELADDVYEAFSDAIMKLSSEE